MSNLLSKIPSKTIGLASALICAYSIVSDGNLKARRETKEDLGNKYTDMYVKNLSSSKESNLLEKVKKYVTRVRLDSSFYPVVYGVTNHVVSWAKEVFENIVPITLSALALGAPLVFNKTPKLSTPKLSSCTTVAINDPEIRNILLKQQAYLSNKAGKLGKAIKMGNLISAVSAGLLLLGAGKLFMHDVLGVGKSNR